MALAKAERKKLQDIMDDPVKWAQAFLRAFDPITKEMKPWTARWYQVEMLRDKSTRKVYRCGRRIGKTETMVVDMLHMAYTHRNFRILMAAPYDNQIRNMFTRLNELIAESPLVKQAVVSTTKNPAKIEFANGSMILGFTTGDDAASIRGQRADQNYIFCTNLWIILSCHYIVNNIILW